MLHNKYHKEQLEIILESNIGSYIQNK